LFSDRQAAQTNASLSWKKMSTTKKSPKKTLKDGVAKSSSALPPSDNDPPVGIVIGRAGQQSYVVGPLIGSGAQAAVHRLIPMVDDPNSTERWVVKVVPVPPSRSSAAKKGKQTLAERNHGSLSYEYTNYMNRFLRLQGQDIPRIPRHVASAGRITQSGMYPKARNFLEAVPSHNCVGFALSLKMQQAFRL
jgi:hypothetical protein